MPLSLPSLALEIASDVRALGGRALVVGGWVRDELFGLEPKDLDLEVFGISADLLRVLLERRGRVDTVGESFTVYKIGGIDVSIPRRESKTGRGHKGFAVQGDPDLSVEDAARRRDFTINAISRDPLSGEVIDPFDGRADVDARRLRVVDTATFGDDSLRVLRALQFAARFDLVVDEETRSLCRALPLDDLPAERVWTEIEKLLLLARRPSIGLALALELGVIDQLFPELRAMVGCPQEPEWHPEGDVWIHTLMVVDEARKRIDGLGRGRAAAIMLGALCHDLGKPLTTAMIDGRVRSLGHEEAGVPPAAAVLDRLNIQTLEGFDVRQTVLAVTAHHLKPGSFMKPPNLAGDGAFRRLAQKVDLELLATVAQADCTGRRGHFDCSAIDAFVARARALGVEHDAPAPLVMGRHLLEMGVIPGPRVGEILRKVYERQLDGEIATVEQGLSLAAALIGRQDQA